MVIGDVRIGAESSVWPGAVLRGDDGHIGIGARTSIQDGSVLHTTPERPTVVGDDCVIGHLVHLEGCTSRTAPSSATGRSCCTPPSWARARVVGSGAVVTGGTAVPPGALAVGIPARIKEGGATPAACHPRPVTATCAGPPLPRGAPPAGLSGELRAGYSTGSSRRIVSSISGPPAAHAPMNAPLVR